MPMSKYGIRFLLSFNTKALKGALVGSDTSGYSLTIGAGFQGGCGEWRGNSYSVRQPPRDIVIFDHSVLVGLGKIDLITLGLCLSILDAREARQIPDGDTAFIDTRNPRYLHFWRLVEDAVQNRTSSFEHAAPLDVDRVMGFVAWFRLNLDVLVDMGAAKTDVVDVTDFVLAAQEYLKALLGGNEHLLALARSWRAAEVAA